jgi:CHAT domain-containing protein
MYKSKTNSLHKAFKLAPIWLLLSTKKGTGNSQKAIVSCSLLVYSLFSCNFATAIDTSSLSRKNSHTLVNVLAQNTPEESNINPPNAEQIKQVAKSQNATLVQYSILYEDVNVDGKKQSKESELYIWVVKPNGEIGMRRVNLQATGTRGGFSLLNLIKRSRRRLVVRSMGLKGGIQAEINPEEKLSKSDLKELHQILIKPIADLLPQKPEEQVVFIPQGDLFLVSFAALQDPNGKYLIEKHTISIAPSVQVLDLLYQRKIKLQGEKSFIPGNIKGDELLIVGNPTAPKVSLKPGEKPFQLSPIPGAEEEAKSIAEIFKTKALTGDAATETAIVQRMPQAKIIHLATHTCKLNNSNVIALATSNQDDGWLSVEEIQKLKLKADLVVLSSENTALGKITGDGVIGLSRAFFVAGADSVVGTLWEADDMTMAFLMTEFYGNLSRNGNKAGALRQAMLETMKKYPNPQDWAGFTLIGLL